MSPDPRTAARKRAALRHALGQEVLDCLSGVDVVEVLVNPDGRLIVDRIGLGRRDTGVRLTADARERAVKLIADHMGESVARETPRLAGVLPETGERFQGLLPPVVEAPAFAIRKRPAVIWALEDYVRQGFMTDTQIAAVRAAVQSRANILISGGTGSGKTTLANAVLAEPAFADDRVFMIEDTPELQCAAWDTVSVVTRRDPAIGVIDLVRDALRMRPDRIVVGELREGAAALETLKSWNTGHPGGLSTIHANSGLEALNRLEDLLSEVVATPAGRLVGRSVDRIVHIRRTEKGRLVESVIAVEGHADGGYLTRTVA